jgi:outer membrane protein OmpA-like peptidoglycan-associated protein
MPWSAVVIGRLALAVLAMAAAPAACAQQSPEANESASLPGGVSTNVIVHPARVPVAGSPPASERAANLRPPPEGPIESHLMPIPEGSNLRRSRDGRASQPAPAGASAAPPAGAPASTAVFATLPVAPLASGADRPAMADASGRELAAGRPASEPAASPDGTSIAIISFAGQSANLTETTKSELDQIAKRIADKKLRNIELRAFATGNDLDSRKIALARALVVRAYLIDSGVKSRIEVGSFAGDGAHVEILVPKT